MEKYYRLRKEKKQELAIALSLPEEEGNIRDKVFSELDV